MDTNEQPTEVVEEETEATEVVEPEVQETEEVTEEAEPTQEVEEEEAPEPTQEDEELSPRAKKRLESLKIQQLIQQMKTQTPTQPKSEEPLATGMDYSSALDADPDIISKLESDRTQYGQAEREVGRSEALEQVKFIQFNTRLDIDAPRIESKYPVLDKSSDQFNPAVANALNSMYLSAVGFEAGDETKPAKVQNSNLRYADYIEGLMELADEVASEKNSQTVKNVAKQAAATGLRPDGSKAKSLDLSKDARDMSDDELKAIIARNLK